MIWFPIILCAGNLDHLKRRSNLGRQSDWSEYSCIIPQLYTFFRLYISNYVHYQLKFVRKLVWSAEQSCTNTDFAILSCTRDACYSCTYICLFITSAKFPGCANLSVFSTPCSVAHHTDFFYSVFRLSAFVSIFFLVSLSIWAVDQTKSTH